MITSFTCFAATIHQRRMVSFTRFATTYLLAMSTSSNREGKNRSPTNKRGSPGVGNRSKHRNKDRDTMPAKREEVLAPPPDVTVHGDPLPFYYTCRHTYEDALMEEISRAKISVKTSSPSPGLVRVDLLSTDEASILTSLDPIYALQSLPNCSIVTAPSIRQLALKVLEVLHMDGSSEESQTLKVAPRGSLAVHALVPGMFKGQRDPVLKRRADKIAEEAVAELKKGYKCARKRNEVGDNDGDEKWVLQLLLFSPEVVAASLTRCETSFIGGMTWPNWRHPAGMTTVDIVEVMPSSAYRKLLEAFECLRALPPRAEHPRDDVPPVVDLGACPGGWTKALRLLGCKVIAVDRSELEEELMADDFVEFIKGDAFSYEPPWAEEAAPGGAWMVSDVVAYPERVAELLDRWCGGRWAGHMVVTAKFQGEAIPWDALDAAVGVVRAHGYKCRVKHFFNNKNEVTLMIAEETAMGRVDDAAFLGKPMYSVALPLSP